MHLQWSPTLENNDLHQYYDDKPEFNTNTKIKTKSMVFIMIISIIAWLTITCTTNTLVVVCLYKQLQTIKLQAFQVNQRQTRTPIRASI